MGVKNLSEICRNLVANGRSPETPVAVIRWGTTLQQETVVGNLSDIVKRVKDAGIKPPAITVVGEVVRLREELSWFENRPLFGRRIVVTRAREQASDFRLQLSRLGAECIEFPTIAIEQPRTWQPLDEAVRRLSSYQWVIFTSVNGVKFFMERLWAAGLDVRELKNIRVAAIGPKTAEALEKSGLRPDLVPEEYRAESILEGLPQHLEGVRFLMPRAAVARDVLPVTLRERGASVDVVTAYETALPQEKCSEIRERLRRGEIHCLTFTSSSTVTNLFKLLPKEEVLNHMDGVAVACIGPITAKTASEYGLMVHIMPREYTIAALVEAIRHHFETQPPKPA